MKTYEGGGRILDFIVAIKLHRDGELIAREYAHEVMNQILDGKKDRELSYGKRHGRMGVDGPSIIERMPFWKSDRELSTWGDEG